MRYTFELIGISPLLDFFQHQQTLASRSVPRGPAYLGSQDCKLDYFLESAESVTPVRGWNLDEVVDAVIGYWINHEVSIRHWHDRLINAGQSNLLVARLTDYKAMQQELESLVDHP